MLDAVGDCLGFVEVQEMPNDDIFIPHWELSLEVTAPAVAFAYMLAAVKYCADAKIYVTLHCADNEFVDALKNLPGFICVDDEVDVEQADSQQQDTEEPSVSATAPVDLLVVCAHQDDELLTFGGIIADALAKGQNVKVACMGHGEKTCVRNVLNDGCTCDWHEGTHTYELSKPELIECRDRELLASAQALGVPAQDVVFASVRCLDDERDVLHTKAALELLLGRYHPARVVTHSPLPKVKGHADHRAIGLAAWLLNKSGAIANLEFAVEPYCIENALACNPSAKFYDLDLSEASVQAVQKAAPVYKKWNPAARSYAIGYHSVRREFDDFLAHPRFVMHDSDVLSEDGLEGLVDAWYLQAQVHQLNKNAQTLEQERAALNQRIDELQNQVSQARAELETVRNSTSFKLGWALTAPARHIKTKLRGEA